MKLQPNATMDLSTQIAVSAAFGLGEPTDAIFVARGAMGSVNRFSTLLHGEARRWAVKRSYWDHYTGPEIAREVRFTNQCRTIGINSPRSIQQVNDGGYVLTVCDDSGGEAQYRILEWVEGDVGRSDDPRTIPLFAEWMAGIHNLAIDPVDHPIDEWFIRIKYNWEDLTSRLKQRAPDVADNLWAEANVLQELSEFVNSIEESGAVMCHTYMGPDNLVWGQFGPHLIDWENAGPLVPHQELGLWTWSLGPLGKQAYHSYREAGGPAEITDVTHLASSIAVILNYVGGQADLLLNDNHVEQHEFARTQLEGAGNNLPSLQSIDQWIKKLGA